MGKLLKRIAIAAIVIGMALLFVSVANFSPDTCNSIQNRAGDLQIALRRN
jgi:hypothetical protein